MLTFDLPGGHSIPQGLVTVYVAIILIFIFMIYVNYLFKKKKSKKIESNFEMIVIMLMEFLADIPLSFLGRERGPQFIPLSIVLYLIIFLSNVLVLIGLREGASAIIFPLTLAFIMFIFWTIYAIYTVGIKRYLKEYLEPIPVMLPMEIIGRIAMPISMAMRLFGNIFSGVLIMTIVWAALGVLIKSGIVGAIFGVAFGPVIGAALGFYFSVFAPFIQALVFTSLTMSNINSLVE